MPGRVICFIQQEAGRPNLLHFVYLLTLLNRNENPIFSFFILLFSALGRD